MKRIGIILGILLVSLTGFSQEYLKMMTYNVRNAKGMDGCVDYQRVANIIRNAAPDIVAVQELDSMTHRYGQKYALGEIAERAQMYPIYLSAIPFDGGKYGIGILCREVPIRCEGFPLPGREEERGLLIAEFEGYIFACTHLSLTEEDRMASLRIIREQAARSTKPFFLAGDLNAEPGSGFIQELEADFKILNDPKAMTFPADEPDRTLDYIALYKSTAPIHSVESRRVLEEPLASDHRPVEVILRTAMDPDSLFRTKPYLQNPTDGGMTVMWETVIPTYSWVEFGQDTTHLQMVRPLVDGQAEFNESIHKVRLENLTPGAKYYYRVCSQEILYYGGYTKTFGHTARSPFYTFETVREDADSFTAVIFNDLHQRKNVFDTLLRQVEDIDYDFVIFNGDCIDDPKDRDQVTHFMKILTEGVHGERIPTFFIRGNHEIRNAYSIGLRKHMDYAGGRTFGGFNWGDTRIVVLDCGEDKKDDHREYSGLNDFTHLRMEQVDFLKGELSSKEFKEAKKRILVHHIPIYGWKNGNLCEPLWRPLLENAPFDLAVNGHMHSYAFHPKGACENPYPVVVGGGKSVESATVMVLTKDGDELHLKVLNHEGKVLLDWRDNGDAPASARSGVYDCTIDGVGRRYKLYIPEGIKPDAPLVFVLHGYGGGIDNLEKKGFNEAADRHGFAVCYPLGSKDGRGNNCWNVGYPFQKDMTVDDISFLSQLAKRLQKEYDLSSSKTFLTGMSNGGEMCYLLAYSGQKTFKAVAPIAGLTMAWMPQEYTRTRPIPIFEIHGTEDRVSEWGGDLENKGGWGAYIPVPDAVDYWVERNGCKNVVTDTLELKREGGHRIITHKYEGGRSGCDVWLYEVVGAGHSWFTEDIDTAEEIWKFFSKYIPLQK